MATLLERLERLARARSVAGRTAQSLRASSVIEAARRAGAPIPADDDLGLKAAGQIPVLDAQRNALGSQALGDPQAVGSIDASLRGAPQSGVEGVPPVVLATPGSAQDVDRPAVDIVGRARAAAFEGSPADIIEQRILSAASPTADAGGGFSENVFAGFRIARSFPNAPGVNAAFSELAGKYGVQLTGSRDRDLQSIVSAVVSGKMKADASVAPAPNSIVTNVGNTTSPGVMLGGEARRTGEGLSGQQFADIVGPDGNPQVNYFPLEIRESGVEPKPVIGENGKPMLDADGRPMVQFLQTGEDSDQIVVRQAPFSRSRVFAARNAGEGIDPLVDKSRELTVMAIRRTGGDGNRSAASKIFVLPVDGQNGQRMYQLVDVEGKSNQLMSETAMRDMVNSQGWEHFAGPKLPGLRDPSLQFPPTPEAAGRQLVEYLKSGAPQGTVLAVRDLDRLKAQGNGELFQQSIALAGGGTDAEEAERVIEALAARKRFQVALQVRSEMSGPDLTGDLDPDRVVAALRDRPEFYGLHDSEVLDFARIDSAELEELATKPFNPGAQAAVDRFSEAYKRGIQLYNDAKSIAVAHDPQLAYDSVRAGSTYVGNPDPLAADTINVQPENLGAFFRNEPAEVVDPKTGAVKYRDPTHEKLRQIELGYGPEDTIPRGAIGADPAENAARIAAERDRAAKLKQVIERVARLRQASAQPVQVSAGAVPAGASEAVGATTPSVGTFTETTDPSMSIGQLPLAPIEEIAEGPLEISDRSAVLDEMFGVRPQPAGAMNFGVTDGSWASDQVRRAKAIAGRVDLGSSPIDVGVPGAGDVSAEARRLSIAIGTRRRMAAGGTYDKDKAYAALKARTEFAGVSDEQMARYIDSPIEDLMGRADAATSTAEQFAESRVAGPRVMTQITRGGLPGNINAQRPIASQVDAVAGTYRTEVGQEGLDSANAAIRQHKDNLRAIDAELRQYRRAHAINELTIKAVRQHLKDLQWRQTLTDDPGLAAQVAGTPDADPPPVSQRPEFSSIGKDELAGIDSLTDEADAASVLDSLQRQGESLLEPMAVARARRQTVSAMLEAAGGRADDASMDVAREVDAATRAAGSEDVTPYDADVNRVESGVDQQDRELTADFARQNRTALEDFGLSRSAEKMRQDYADALSSEYGPTVTRPLAIRDYESRFADARPSEEQIHDIEDMQRAIDKERDPAQRQILQAQLEEKAAAFSGDTGSAAVVMRHPSGQNQARMLQELASTTSQARRLQLASDLWGVRFTGMDSSWRAPMLPAFRRGKEHGIAVLQTLSRATGTPVSDLVSEALARSAELRDTMTPAEMRHVGKLLQSDIEYANRFTAGGTGGSVAARAETTQSGDSSGIRGLLDRIKRSMGLGPREAPAPRIEEFDANDPILMQFDQIQAAIPSAVGNESLDLLDARITNQLANAEKAGQKPLRSYQAIYERAQELRKAIKQRMGDPAAQYKSMRQGLEPPGLQEDSASIDVTSRAGTSPQDLGAGQTGDTYKIGSVEDRDSSLAGVYENRQRAKDRLDAAKSELEARTREAKKTKTPESRAARTAAMEEFKQASADYKKARGSLSRASTTVLISQEDAEQLKSWLSGRLTGSDASVDRATGWPKLTVSTGNPGVLSDGSAPANITVERTYRTYDDTVYDKKTGTMVRSKVGSQPKDVTMQRRITGRVVKPIENGGTLTRGEIPDGMVAVDLDADGTPMLFHGSARSPDRIELGDSVFSTEGRRPSAADGAPANVRVRQYNPSDVIDDGFEENAPVNTGKRYTYEGTEFVEDTVDEDAAVSRHKDSADAAAERSQKAASGSDLDRPKSSGPEDSARRVRQAKDGTAGARRRGTSALMAGGMALGAASLAGSGSDVALGGDFGFSGDAAEDTNQWSKTPGGQVRTARRRRYTLLTPANPTYW